MTRIGIIGDGNVGSALERGFGESGHETRAVGHDAGKVREAAQWAEAVVLAVPFDERENAFEEMGDAVSGKIVIDVTNAVGKDGFVGRVDESGAEGLQRAHPDVRVVKAFNTVFANHMDQGEAAGETLTLFVAADDASARQQIMTWGERIGFDPVDAGGIENARWLEMLGYLNITLGYTLEHGTDTGFRYVHPKGAPRRDQIAAEAAE